MGEQIIQSYCKIGSLPKLNPTSSLEITKACERYSWIMQNALKSYEWLRIWVHKTFKTQIQKGGPNNLEFLQNWFHPKNFVPPL